LPQRGGIDPGILSVIGSVIVHLPVQLAIEAVQVGSFSGAGSRCRNRMATKENRGQESDAERSHGGPSNFARRLRRAELFRVSFHFDRKVASKADRENSVSWGQLTASSVSAIQVHFPGFGLGSGLRDEAEGTMELVCPGNKCVPHYS
jgi:hypothetical protein